MKSEFPQTAITADELRLESSEPEHVLARVREALETRPPGGFAERLTKAAPWGVPGLAATALALAIQVLHESYLEHRLAARAEGKRGRGRLAEPTSDLERSLLGILATVRMPEGKRCDAVARIVNGMWGGTRTGREVGRRASAFARAFHKRAPSRTSPGYVYDQPMRDTKNPHAIRNRKAPRNRPGSKPLP